MVLPASARPELPERPQYLLLVGEKKHERPERQTAAHHELETLAEHDRQLEDAEKAAPAPVEGQPQKKLEHLVAEPPVRLGKAAELVALAGERTHHAHAGYVFLHDARKYALPLVHPEEYFFDHLMETDRKKQDQRKNDRSPQSHARIEKDHHGKRD